MAIGRYGFWKIESDEDIVTVKWSHNYFEDYKILSYQFLNVEIEHLMRL